MAITREKKEQIVEEITNKFSDLKAAVFTDFKGLTAEELNELRKEFKKKGLLYKVIKHSLLELSLKKAGIPFDLSLLKAHSLASAFGQDEMEVSKVVYDFSKKHDNLTIIGGILNKQAVTKDQIETLALLPSREDLYAKLVGSLNAPLFGLVNTLQANLRNLVYILNAYQKQRT